MASNYTETLKLCQWEGSDYFNHEEFNDDNLKIENAYQLITAKLTELEGKITEAQQLAADAKLQLLVNELVEDSMEATLIFDITNIDVSDYAYLVLECSWDNTAENMKQARIRLNGHLTDYEEDYYKTFSGTTTHGCVSSIGDYSGVVKLNLMYQDRIPVTTDSSAAGLFSSGISVTPPSELEKIYIVGYDADSKFTNFTFKVWGMKK